MVCVSQHGECLGERFAVATVRGEQEDPGETTGRRELHVLIRERIQQLNRQQQKVLLLFYYEGLRMKDVAELMNISESRVCQINTEAVLSLRSFLKRQERTI